MSRQKTAVVITAFIMLISVFALDVSEASAVSSSTYKIKVNTQIFIIYFAISVNKELSSIYIMK